jgi:hypothetical protein
MKDGIKVSALVTKDNAVVTVYFNNGSAVYFPATELALENVDLKITKVGDGEWKLEAWPRLAKAAEATG